MCESGVMGKVFGGFHGRTECDRTSGMINIIDLRMFISIRLESKIVKNKE